MENEDVLENSGTNRKISSFCTWAIAGQVVGIASAVTIDGPVGLGFWIAGQAISIQGIYSSSK